MKTTRAGRTLSDVLADLQRDEGFAAAWAFEEPMLTLAANLARIRHARRLTQKELAAKAGMKQPRIAEIERGDANPELKTLIRLAHALGVKLADLHDESPRPAISIGTKSYRVRVENHVPPDPGAWVHALPVTRRSADDESFATSA